ncbi:hypothetical protein LFM09_33290 [Lentzea alba]|uniref:DUF7716 domain-containing protein n=1 Tax=Lentzea alba TaxID=2714351 RepID=UPI0039BEE957
MIARERPWPTTWGNVIESIRELDDHDLICFGGGPASPDDPCLIVDSRSLDPDEDVPVEAAFRDWTTTLIEDEVLQIIENLCDQVDDPGLALMIRAIAHYVDNDAFIEVS